MYKTSHTTSLDVIHTDKKIDMFLREHFTQYAEYCTRSATQDVSDNYVVYCGIKEEPQYDDLTIVALQKK